MTLERQILFSHAGSWNWRKAEIRLISNQRLERRTPGVFRLRPQLFLDPLELVVLGGTVGARERPGLDLSALRGNREIRDGCILGLALAVRHDGGEYRRLGHMDRRQR